MIPLRITGGTAIAYGNQNQEFTASPRPQGLQSRLQPTVFSSLSRSCLSGVAMHDVYPNLKQEVEQNARQHCSPLRDRNRLFTRCTRLRLIFSSIDTTPLASCTALLCAFNETTRA